ncbi:MAG: zf-HC2 domain-containing protein [Proteobacteria bacterium]|nr:zf-HC2 domain-containing protein [Pseudomonadota bacterium]
MNIPLMRSCREVTRMVSRGEDRELSSGERVTLRAHLAICRGCRNAIDPLRFLRRVACSLQDGDEPSAGRT